MSVLIYQEREVVTTVQKEERVDQMNVDERLSWSGDANNGRGKRLRGKEGTKEAAWKTGAPGANAASSRPALIYGNLIFQPRFLLPTAPSHRKASIIVTVGLGALIDQKPAIRIYLHRPPPLDHLHEPVSSFHRIMNALLCCFV